MAGVCVWCGGALVGTQKRFCCRNHKSIYGVTQWRRRIKRWAIEYKGGKCQSCGYDKCQAAMVFHHTEMDKVFGIGNGSARSKGKLRKELDKCVLLCLNCHAEQHFELVHHCGIV